MTVTPVTPSRPRAAGDTVSCPECGKVVSRMEIGTHRRKAHGYRVDPNRTPPSLSGKPREAIKLQQCPHCAAMTTLNPCERCHTWIAGATSA